jgi:hypothetical protein
MERITEIFVILENRPSTLGELCSHLAENEINIEAIGVFHDTAKLYIKKLNYMTELRDVLKVDLENRPGALAELTTRLGNRGVNIEYCYGTLSRKGNITSIILDVSDVEKATAILSGD